MNESTNQFADASVQNTEYWMPIVKSEAQSDGRIRVFGLASDHSYDTDDEIIKVNANPSCLDYTNRFGKFDLDHNSYTKGAPFIGDVVSARIISNAEARKKYPDQVVVGDPLEVEGFVYAVTPNAPQDLRLAHYYKETGASMGFSIFGEPKPGGSVERGQDGRLRRVRVPERVEVIAITPQPKNSNSACFFAKSLRAALDGTSDVEVMPSIMDERTPRLYVVSDNIPFRKSLSADSAVIPNDAATGGDSLKVAENSYVRPPSADAKATQRKCSKCDEPMNVRAKFCPQCAAPVLMKSELEGSDNETVMKAISSVREAVEGNSQIARLRAIAARLVKSCQAAGATSKSGGKGRQTRGYCQKCRASVSLLNARSHGADHSRRVVGNCSKCNETVRRFKAH